MPDLKKTIEKEAAKEIEALAAMEAKLGKEAVKLQSNLYRLLVDKYLDALQTDEAGNILYNSKNLGYVNDLNKTWQTFQDKHYLPVINDFAKDLLSIVDIEGAYFGAVGKQFDFSVSIKKTADLISKQIGIDLASGELIKDSYLSRLVEGAEVKSQVQDLVLQNVSAKSSFKDLKANLETLVKGDETTNGAMQQYLRTYAYDTFSNVQRSVDLNIADTYQFNSFIYSGDVITTSREFCIEKVGQVFTRDDLAEWESQDWPGKNPDVPVEISLGGYNCRHTLMWIPDEAVDYFKEGNKNIVDAGDILDNQEWRATLKEYGEPDEKYLNAFDKWERKSEPFNDYVRFGVKSEGIDEKVKDLQGYINNSTKVKGTLYRGTALPDELLKPLLEQLDKGYYMDKGFNSFSVDFGEADRFMMRHYNKYGGNLVNFTLEAKGVNGAMTNNVLEKEVLFMNGTRYSAEYKINERIVSLHGKQKVIDVILKEL